MDIEPAAKIIFLLLLAVLPSLIWLAYFLRRDNRPEPRRFLLFTFAIGGLSTIIGWQAENNWLAPFVQDNANYQIGSLLFLLLYPFLEEIIKFGAARLSTIKNKYFMDEKTDPMVYMITAALGFAAAENMKIFIDIITNSNAADFGLESLNFTQTVITTLLFTGIARFLSTVLLHALSSATFGYFWAMLRLTEKKARIFFIALPLGILLATGLHAIFNYLILNATSNLLFIIPVLAFLLIVICSIKSAFRQLASFS